MYIIDANLTDEQVDSIIAKYSKVVTDQGGELRAVGRWDKRRLAYEIKGRREGLYILMFFEAEPAVVKELDRIYRISDDVFRHLITTVEPEHVDTSRIERPQPVAEAAPEVVQAEETVEAPAEPAAEVVEESTEAVEASTEETTTQAVAETVVEEVAEVETSDEEAQA